jgi:hypothetical protein
VLMWGANGFPEDYRGGETVAYGHWDNAELDPRGCQNPRDLSGFGAQPDNRSPVQPRKSPQFRRVPRYV